MRLGWGGQGIKALLPRAPTCPPVRVFLVALILASFLPIWIGSADPWWRVKEWAVLMVGCGWLATRHILNLRPIRSGQDKWLAILMIGLLTHFFLLFVLPIIRIPNKLFQVPWPWMTFLHAMIALTWLSDMRRLIRKEDVRFLVTFMAGLGVLLSTYMVFQKLELDPIIWFIQKKYSGFKWLAENHVVGLMGNPFQAGATLAVLTPLISFKAFQKRRTAWKLLLPLSLAACYFTSSLSSLVAALVGCMFGAGILQTRRAVLFFLGVIVLLFIGILLVQPQVLLDIGRLEIWRKSLHHILKHPILGVGLSQFKLLGIVQTPNVAYEVRWAHNEWIHFTTELGIGWTLFLAAYLSRETLKLFRIHPAICGAFISILILSFFHIPFHLAPTLAVAGVCLSSSHLEQRKGV